MSDSKQAAGSAGSVKNEAAAAANTLGAKASDVAGKAADITREGADLAGAAGDFASAALEQGRNLVGTARTQATSFADRRKDDAAQSVEELAASLRMTGDSFEDRPNIKAFVESAAEGLENLAASVRGRSFTELYGEFQSFARARPLAVGAASVVAGFVAARFIKSSADASANAHAQARQPTGRAAGRGEA